jgi:hypothetical protein
MEICTLESAVAEVSTADVRAPLGPHRRLEPV